MGLTIKLTITMRDASKNGEDVKEEEEEEPTSERTNKGDSEGEEGGEGAGGENTKEEPEESLEKKPEEDTSEAAEAEAEADATGSEGDADKTATSGENGDAENNNTKEPAAEAEVEAEAVVENGDAAGPAAAAASKKKNVVEMMATVNLKKDNAQDNDDVDEEKEPYIMKVQADGKFTRKANWEDITSFTKYSKPVNSDVLKEWLHEYLQRNFPDQLTKEHCIPKTCWIKDDNKFCTVYKDYKWKPIKLNLTPGLVDIKERQTKQIVLESFEWDYSKDLNVLLQEQGDKSVLNYLKKSKLAGHPLALEMMTSSSEIVTEFRGIDSTVFCLGNNQAAAEVEEETGSQIWKDVKSLRALLKDKPKPVKTGKGVTRTIQVLALESKLKARVYYKASFTGTVSTDHIGKFDGRRYWNWPLKYLLQYNDLPNAAVIYEDVELQFYTNVEYAMENQDWEWVNVNGSWVKQKLK